MYVRLVNPEQREASTKSCDDRRCRLLIAARFLFSSTEIRKRNHRPTQLTATLRPSLVFPPLIRPPFLRSVYVYAAVPRDPLVSQRVFTRTLTRVRCPRAPPKFTRLRLAARFHSGLTFTTPARDETRPIRLERSMPLVNSRCRVTIKHIRYIHKQSLFLSLLDIDSTKKFNKIVSTRRATTFKIPT